jgi:predicted Zn-ribbon and HTH transcriptional regulator
VQFEPALEIVGALKRRFGEPLTVSEICRLVPLSYQPVYEYVRRLAKAKAVSLRKEGQRLLCEPAATASGSLWLAQWSVRELRSSRDPLLRELAGAAEGRMSAEVGPTGAIVALDPMGRGRVEAYVTDAGVRALPGAARVRVVSAGRLAEALQGSGGSWSVARRVIPVAGHQQLWSLALTAREQAAGRAEEPRTAPVRRAPAFID